MHLTLVRHGETKENVLGITQGHAPGTLTEQGYEQIHNVAQRLCGREFDASYSSDLLRCTETARIINEMMPELHFIYTPRIREMGRGVFQGIKHDEVPWDSLEGTWLTRKPEGGESIEEYYQRGDEFLKELYSKHAGQKILLVTHGGFIRLAYALATQHPLEKLDEIYNKLHVKNTAISEIHFSDKGGEIISWDKVDV